MKNKSGTPPWSCWSTSSSTCVFHSPAGGGGAATRRAGLRATRPHLALRRRGRLPCSYSVSNIAPPPSRSSSSSHIFRPHPQVRAYRGFCWVLGFRPPQQKVQLTPSSITPERHNVSGRKRVHGLTRMLLCVLPRWLQRVLGFRSYSSIGRCASPGGTESTSCTSF